MRVNEVDAFKLDQLPAAKPLSTAQQRKGAALRENEFHHATIDTPANSVSPANTAQSTEGADQTPVPRVRLTWSGSLPPSNSRQAGRGSLYSLKNIRSAWRRRTG